MKEIVFTVLASGALFSFIQFLVTRADNKKNIQATLEKKIDDGFAEIKGEVKGVSEEVKTVSDRLEEHKATLARTHILRFADEQKQYVKQGTSHSEEYFRQQILDIDVYNSFCEKHPEFSNGLTRMASDYIRREYKRVYLDPPASKDND